MKKHRGVYEQPGRSGVLITQHAFESMWEDAEIAKAAAKMPVGWTLRRDADGWVVLDSEGVEQSCGERELYRALYMAGFAEEV